MTFSERLGLPVAGARIRLVQGGPAGSRVLVVAEPGGVGVGAIEAELPGEGQTLFVRSFCIDEPRRGYGAGSEAARLLIRAAFAAGISSVRAWAPPDRGLALYFWMRMGLRPLHGEGPEGGIWLERTMQE